MEAGASSPQRGSQLSEPHVPRCRDGAATAICNWHADVIMFVFVKVEVISQSRFCGLLPRLIVCHGCNLFQWAFIMCIRRVELSGCREGNLRFALRCWVKGPLICKLV